MNVSEALKGFSAALGSLFSECLTNGGKSLYEAIEANTQDGLIHSIDNADLNKIAHDFATKEFNRIYKADDSLRQELREFRLKLDTSEAARQKAEEENSRLSHELTNLEADYAKARARERLYNVERAIIEEELFAAKSGANRYRKLAIEGINLPLRVVISPGGQNFLHQGDMAQEMSLHDRLALHGALYGKKPCADKGCEGGHVHPPQEHIQTTPFKVGDMKTEVKANMTGFQEHMNRAIDKLERTIKTNRPNMAPDKFTASTKTLDRLRGMFQ